MLEDKGVHQQDVEATGWPGTEPRESGWRLEAVPATTNGRHAWLVCGASIFSLLDVSVTTEKKDNSYLCWQLAAQCGNCWQTTKGTQREHSELQWWKLFQQQMVGMYGRCVVLKPFLWWMWVSHLRRKTIATHVDNNQSTTSQTW